MQDTKDSKPNTLLIRDTYRPHATYTLHTSKKCRPFVAKGLHIEPNICSFSLLTHDKTPHIFIGRFSIDKNSHNLMQVIMISKSNTLLIRDTYKPYIHN